MSTVRNSDTIFAVSTSAMKAAIAVLRVSGPHADSVLHRVCGRAKFADRNATLTRIFDESGNLLDRALVIRFASPRSFTGEDMVEFHVTGGRAVVDGLLRVLRECPGARPAEAGEFAKRAFENGKLDLVEVEALSSIVEAETRAQLRHANNMASGRLSQLCEDIRGTLLRSTAHVESMLDFSDVEDAEGASVRDILPSLQDASLVLQSILRGAEVSERLREGMTVVIAGPPNVGKSALLNHLARRDVAIVSSTPGTTRDTLEVAADVGGFPVVFVDTAGVRDTADPVELEGINRAKQRAARADLVLWLMDHESASPPRDFGAQTLVLRSKADLMHYSPNSADLAISTVSGQGISDLVARVADYAVNHFAVSGDISVGTERQRFAVQTALAALQEVLQNPNQEPEIIAENLRSAARSMGRISGQIGVEEVLGEIFSQLCVGK